MELLRPAAVEPFLKLLAGPMFLKLAREALAAAGLTEEEMQGVAMEGGQIVGVKAALALARDRLDQSLTAAMEQARQTAEARLAQQAAKDAERKSPELEYREKAAREPPWPEANAITYCLIEESNCRRAVASLNNHTLVGRGCSC